MTVLVRPLRFSASQGQARSVPFRRNEMRLSPKWCRLKAAMRTAARSRLRASGLIGATLWAAFTWASPASAGDWAQPIVSLQQSLAAAGISLGGGVTTFGQGLAAGAGSHAVQLGGKTDVLLGLDGSKLGLWTGFSVSVHLEQAFGEGVDAAGASAILPVNTALGFPRLGGTMTDLSVNMTQKFGDAAALSLGKFNMLDVAGRTPLMGGGGEATFWNIGLAAPVSGVTPPYILGGIATLNTTPATFTLMVYDPRNAQDLAVINRPFAEGTSTSLSMRVPLTLFGLPGYHTFRGVYSTAEGFNFDAVPQLVLPSGSEAKLTKRGYTFGSYTWQQFLWQDPANATNGWGFFVQVSASDANPNPIGATVIVGLGGTAPGRPDDRWGVAWCDYVVSSRLNSGLAILGGGLNDERVLEAYYDTAVVPHIRLGPDLQIIWPGTRDKPTALFLGLRGRLVL